MKRSFNKFLALCLTMLLATSGIGYMEPIDMEVGDLSGIEIDMPIEGADGPSGQGETPAGETGGLQLGDDVQGLLDLPQPLDNASLQLDVPAEVTLKAEVEGLTFAVTGVLSPETVLSVARPEDEALAEAAARSTENLLEKQVAHNIFCIELLDGAGKRIALDPLALPIVTVNGLSADGVTVYDSALDGSYELELDQKAVCFKLAEQGIYDLYGRIMAQPEEQPADDPQEQPADDTSTPADGDTSDDTSIPDDISIPADGDTSDELSTDDQKPSPDGEGGAAQSAVTDEVPSTDDESTPTSGDTADESSADDQPSPDGEGALTGADEVPSTDDESTPTPGDTADESSTDDDQKPSPDGEGAPTAPDEVSLDGITVDEITGGETEDDTSTEDDQTDGQPQNGDTSDTSIGLQPVSPDGEPASPQEEALGTPDNISTPTDGDTADDQQEQPTDDQKAQSDDEGTSSGADAPPSPEGKAFGEQPTDDTSTNTDGQQEQPTDDTSTNTGGQQEQPTDDISIPTSGDTADESTTDDDQPSPAAEGSDSGEGGTAQSAVTDEVGSPDDGDTVDGSDTDDQKPSPDGEGAPTGADEVPSSDDASASDDTDEVPASDDESTPASGDTADESSTDDDQKPSPDGEGAPTGADEVPASDDASASDDTDEVPASDDESTPASGDTADESSTDDDQKPSPDGEGAPTGADEVPSSDDASASDDTDEVPASDDESTPTDGDTADDQQPTDDTPTSPDPAPVAFDQSVTLNNVTVTVQAEPGVFPANAVLSVKRVPSYKRRQADAAIEEIRDEDQNVAVSYTFDIKVIDPDTKAELQPAEGQTVNVSFAMAEVADENLTTNVYHIEDGEAQKLDVTTEVTPETGEETTAAVETSGFSLYTVEFTYNNIEYVLSGDASVALSEIMAAVGLTGVPTAVEVSDPALFSASDETGEWVVTARRAFSTTEWMTVAIDGIEYKITVTDDQQIQYLSPNGVTASENCIIIESGTTEWNQGWYAVTSDTTIAGRVTVNGTVNLILVNNVTLTVSKGITVAKGATLNIYAQSTEAVMGKLYAGTTTGSNHQCDDNCAGIGGGDSSDTRDAGTINITGGTVTAIGGANAAGIGGGYNGAGGTITINGGTVTATGGIGGAGIGGGKALYDATNNVYNGGKGGTITISGGTTTAPKVEVTGGTNASGIGGGEGGDGGAVTITVTLSEGEVIVHGADDGAQLIGHGANGAKPGSLSLMFMHAYTSADDSGEVQGSVVMGACRSETAVYLRLKRCSAGTSNGCENCTYGCYYIDADGNTQELSGEYTPINSGISEPQTWETGWYVVTGNPTIEGRVTVSGTVNLILCDNAALTAAKGINVAPGNALNIYAQSTENEKGKLYAGTTVSDGIDCDEGDAGIGGTSGDCGDITIYGGDITARGGKPADNTSQDQYAGGAGIGGGGNGDGGNITICGGKVTTTGGLHGAGIGGGYYGNGGNIAIYGGTVTTTGGDSAAGIGGGYRGSIGSNGHGGSGGDIAIYGGTVTANGGGSGAGIGGGYNGSAGTIKISSPNGSTEINATGGSGAAGIGSGQANAGGGGSITIDGGKITATGSTYGAGIGGGASTMSGNITINGGEITANGGLCGGAGIGNGCLFSYTMYGTDSTITINGGNITARGGVEIQVNNTLYGGAGIGGGDGNSGGTITITGAYTVVYAYGGVERKDGSNITSINGFGAGIGGGLNKYASNNSYSNGGTIEIRDGAHVYAYGGELGGAGIGSGPAKMDVERTRGVGSKGGKVTILGEGTVVEAYGGDGGVYYKTNTGNNETFPYGGGAGIGGGFMGDGADVTIDISGDAHVYAYGGEWGGAGIGGGYGGKAGDDDDEVNINGDVRAIGGDGGVEANYYYFEDVSNNVYYSGTIQYYGGAGIGGGGTDPQTLTGNSSPITVKCGDAIPVTITGGTVEATGGADGGAGIGGGGYKGDAGGKVTVTGGTVTATGGTSAAGIGGGLYGKGADVEISGTGTEVTATGGNKGGAGIGGGYQGDAGGKVTITGGTVTATGGDGGTDSNNTVVYSGGAGIGGGGNGGSGGSVTISGGTVNATGGAGGTGSNNTVYSGGAGIGGSSRGTTGSGDGGPVTISGGNVTATGKAGGAGIGGGENGKGGKVTISGGNVTANGAGGGAGIGGGKGGIGGPVTISGANTNVVAIGNSGGAGIGGGARGAGGTIDITGGSTVRAFGGKPMTPSNTDDITKASGTQKNTGTGAGIGGGGGSNGGDGGEVTISGANTHVYAYGGTDDAGGGAGIGGGGDSYTVGNSNGGDGGTVTISDGAYVKATGGEPGAAGIGGGQYGAGGTVTIGGEGTKVEAKGGGSGAGIGGGRNCAGGTITITGGTVEATGGNEGAGIGGGFHGAGGTVEISGADTEVTATGGTSGAGIGGGNQGAGGTVTITGGKKVQAIGGTHGAGIGGGGAGNGGTATISGGTVEATGGGDGGAGIGGGLDGHGGVVEIGGGKVTANGIGGGAGIGGGGRYRTNGGNGGMVSISGGTVTVTIADTGAQFIGRCNGGEDPGALSLARMHASINTDNYNGFVPGSDVLKACRNSLESETYGTPTQLVLEKCNHDDSSGHCNYGDDLCTYIDEYGNECSLLAACTEIDNTNDVIAGTGIADISSGWYMVKGVDVTKSGRLVVHGTVNLILFNDAKLTMAQGINVSAGNTLNIYAQKSVEGENTGELFAGTSNGTDVTCMKGSAGIGGGYYNNNDINPIAGTINIYGGRITAHGGEAEGTDGGAGIGGGGRGYAGGTVRITRGEVTAIGGKGIQKTSELPKRYFGGAGIGGSGCGGDGDTVVITGGTVEAIGAYGGAGIGGGGSSKGGDGGTIEISGADTEVTAKGGEGSFVDDSVTYTFGGAGIGGGGGSGNGGNGGETSISGGAVEAIGAYGGAGIGGGGSDYNQGVGGNGGEISITGGEVTATGNDGGAGIGGGGDNQGAGGNGGEISISGGTVTATGNEGGAGIGGGGCADTSGNGGSGGDIAISGGEVTATGNDGGAGIGGGDQGAGGNIAIRGGAVTAIGGEYNNEFAGGIGAGRAYTGSAATTIKLTPNGGEPVVKANAYLGTLTLDGDFCEKLSGGSYGAVFDADKDPTPVSDAVKAILAGRTIAPANGTIYKISSTFVPNEPAGNKLDVTVNGIPVTRALAGTSLTLTVEGNPVRFVPSGATYGGNTVSVPKNGVFTMPDADVTINLTRWAWLQQQIDAAANTANSAAITLPYDFSAQAWETALAVPAGNPVTIDLNGHKIDRALNSAVNGGNAVTVKGTLTLKDGVGGGAITGGNNSGNGGGVIVDGGTFNMSGGRISGNSAAQGGGVCVTGGAFNMSGGEISGNTAATAGGGIGFMGGALKLSGSPTVTGNTAGGRKSNLWTDSARPFAVAGALGDKASVGVNLWKRGNNGYAPATGVFATGVTEKDIARFTSDDGYGLGFTAAGAAALKDICTLSFSIEGWTYDGTAHAPVPTVTGASTGEVAYTYYKDAACSTKTTTADGASVAGGAPKNTGNYWVKASVAETDAHLGATAGAKSFTIGRKTVGLSWANTSFTYDGKSHAPTATATGLVGSDACAVTVIGAQTNAGSYTAKASGLSNGNYQLPTGVTQSFSIGKKTVGLSWANTSFTYDGKSHAPTATATGLVGSDACAVTVTGAQTNAGSYTATASGLSNGNYQLPTGVTQSFSIGKKTVGLTWANTSFTYDGKSHAPTATATGLVGSDACAVTVSGAQTNAGSYTAKASGLSNGNYQLPTGVTQSFSIGKKTVGLSWANTSFTYDGKSHAPTATATGLVGSDACAVTVSGAQTNAGSYTATASGLSNGNYQLPTGVTQSFSIGKKTVGLSWKNTSFTYDGKSHAPTATATGLVGSDACAVTVTGAQTNAGSYTAKASGLSNGNYQLPTGVTQSFSIGKKTVGLSWANTSFTYDGKSHAPTATATGLAGSDTCAVTVTGAKVKAGSYTATASGLSNANYALPTANTKAFTIGKKTVGLSWKNTSFTYDGKSHAPTATATGLVGSDACTVTVTGAKVKAGSYTATAKSLSNANYALPKANTKAFKINKKTLTVKAADKTKVQGEADPALTYTVKGLVGNDKLSGALSRKAGEKPGKYAITQGTLSASANYTIKFTGATFTIKAKTTPTPVPAKPDVTLLAKMVYSKNKGFTVSWTAVKGAKGYDVFFCKYGEKLKKVKTVTGSNSFGIKGTEKGKTYEACVKAWKEKNGVKEYIGEASPSVYAIAGSYTKDWSNVKSVTAKPSKVTLAKGKASAINASVTVAKSGRKPLKIVNPLRYYSSDQNVAKVSETGKINAVGNGSCEIYVIANNGVRATVQVTVTKKPTKVAFAKSAYSVNKDKELDLTKEIVLSPAGVTTTYTWTTSDKNIATVSVKGVVKGVKKGTATITVETGNGKTAKVKVTVK